MDPTCGCSLVSIGYDKDFAELADDASALTQPPVPAPGWQCVDFDAVELTVQVPDGVLLDLGATAKALAADLAAEAIAEQIGCGVLVNLGGDIAVSGQAPEGGWRIGVDDGVTYASTAEGGCCGRRRTDRRARRGHRGRRHRHFLPVRAGLAPGSPGPAPHRGAEHRAACRNLLGRCLSRRRHLRRREHGQHGLDHPRPGEAQQWLQSLSLPARLAKPDGRVVTTGGWPP